MGLRFRDAYEGVAGLVGALVWAWRATRIDWPKGRIEALAFSPDGAWLLSASQGGALRLWRTSDLLRGRGAGFHLLRPASKDDSATAPDFVDRAKIVFS